MAALIAAKGQKLKREREATSLTISPQGFIVEYPVATLQMEWSGVRSVGLVKGPKGLDLRKTSLPFLGRGGRTIGSDIGHAVSSAVFTSQIGISGIGTHVLKPDVPRQARWQFEQNFGISGVDDETGQALVAVLAADQVIFSYGCGSFEVTAAPAPTAY